MSNATEMGFFEGAGFVEVEFNGQKVFDRWIRFAGLEGSWCRKYRETEMKGGLAQSFVGADHLTLTCTPSCGEMEAIVGAEKNWWRVAETGVQHRKKLRFEFWCDRLFDESPRRDQRAERLMHQLRGPWAERSLRLTSAQDCAKFEPSCFADGD